MAEPLASCLLISSLKYQSANSALARKLEPPSLLKHVRPRYSGARLYRSIPEFATGETAHFGPFGRGLSAPTEGTGLRFHLFTVHF